MPQRIDDELCEMLGKYHPLWLNIHVNHPNEITPELARACDKLSRAGVPLGNQSVLLAGVNDCVHTQRELVQRLVENRVRPYYLYQCDLVEGAGHFRTPIGKGLEIIEGLRGHTSGYAVPQYIVDAPGGGGKIPVMPNYVVSYSDHKVILRNYEGYITTYEEPTEYTPHDSSTCQFCQHPRPEPGQEGITGLLDGKRMWIEPAGFEQVHERGADETHRLKDPSKWVPYGVGRDRRAVVAVRARRARPRGGGAADRVGSRERGWSDPPPGRVASSRGDDAACRCARYRRSVIVDRILARLERANPQLLDWAVALVLTGVSLVNLFQTPIDQGGREATPVAVGLVLLMNLPLVVRRRYPSETLSVVGISTILYAATGPFTGFGLGVLYALYSLAVYSDPRDSQRGIFYTMIGIGLTFVGVLVNEPGVSLAWWVGQLLTAWLMFGVAWVLGDLVRRRSEAVRELGLRAAELGQERAENERLAVEAERARIARELHDAVAHNVSVMVVQAGAARRTLEATATLDPAGGAEGADGARLALATAREGLSSIETTGRETLVEMRRMVGTLRPVEGAAYEPTPSLAALDALLDRVRSAGLAVDLVIEGETRQLPQGVDLSAYRIVQEALTNTLRHAHAVSARVRLRYGLDVLEVDVTDDGRGAAAAILEAPHRGYGLVGMRERVGMIGGELVAGPRAGGGFEVRASLPLGAPA